MANGSEVLDNKTGLTWQRCALGMFWDGGTCTGRATGHTYDDALAQSKTIARNSGKGWRLPNLDELKSIVDVNRTHPSIDTTAFPGTPPVNSWFWTSTSHDGSSYHNSNVFFGYGTVGKSSHDVDDNRVRFVRR